MTVRTRIGAGVLIIALLLGGCGDSDSAKEGTSAVTAYRLKEGSTIGFADPNSGGSVLIETLSGTFDVTPTTRLPNSFFDFAIVRIDFNSSTFSVVGSTGTLRGSKINPGVAIITAEVRISGEAVNLLGTGAFTLGPTFSLAGLEATGAGYTITLFADPEE